MIRAVTFPHAPFVSRAVARITRRQGAELQRQQELLFDEAKQLLRAVARDEFLNQRDGIELIRTELQELTAASLPRLLNQLGH